MSDVSSSRTDGDADRPEPGPERRYTTRTLLSPDEPAEAAFGTSADEDDALDAVLRDARSADAGSALVWPAEHLPESDMPDAGPSLAPDWAAPTTGLPASGAAGTPVSPTVARFDAADAFTAPVSQGESQGEPPADASPAPSVPPSAPVETPGDMDLDDLLDDVIGEEAEEDSAATEEAEPEGATAAPEPTSTSTAPDRTAEAAPPMPADPGADEVDPFRVDLDRPETSAAAPPTGAAPPADETIRATAPPPESDDPSAPDASAGATAPADSEDASAEVAADAPADDSGPSPVVLAGAAVVSALADIVRPKHDEPSSDEPAPESRDEAPEVASEVATSEPSTDEIPDPFGAEPVADASDADASDTDTSDTDAPSHTDRSAPPVTETATADTQEITADVDAAFEAQADAHKPADAPSGIEGDLDVAPLTPGDFEPDDLKAVLRTMMTSRRLDEKMLTLLKQGKGFFHIGSAGHEASQTAVAREFEGGHDWFCFYYRDLATALTVGITPAEVLRAHFGKADDVFGGGRQMPEHFGHRDLNVLSTSSSVGAQYVPAVGFALAVAREDDPADGPTRAVYASGGEGSTSQGAFHEALNWAARESLPVLFHIQDNKYAISVPVEEQTAGGSIWSLLGGYAGLARIRYDGTDFFQSAAAARAAMAHIRAGRGPVALHADLVRLLPHSSSDDHKKYREAASIEADAARDPIPQLARHLVEAGILTDDEVEAMRAEVSQEIDRLAKEIEKEADPDPDTATRHVYHEGGDDRTYEAEGETGSLIVMVDAINHALDEEMARDERVLVYGEDVGGGKGGVFTATRGLTEKHGRDRCFNSPLAEHSILGSAVGLACAGYKPVVEIQFADYIWPGMQQIRNQIASMRYRSNGTWANPMVIRVPAGGYIHGGLCHSQNVEAMFGHFPGLHVVMPSNAADAKGLLKSAIRGHDPVIFLEHKALYRQGPARRPEPHADYLVPLGKAAVAREGSDLTIVTWGAIVYKALNVAKTLEREGVSVEVIDLRSILPYDADTVLASACKTHRVLVAYEDHEFMGFGAEVAAQLSDAAFGHLDAPVKRVGGAFSSIPYADPLEKAVLPQDDDVLRAAREVLAF